MRLESDLVDALEASIDGRVSEGDFKWSSDAAVCVVLASGGYPGTFDAGKRIMGLEHVAQEKGVKVFHAGTSSRDGAYYTSGGRVLGVTARAPQLAEAVAQANEACAHIGFEGMHYRKDIAARALKR
jgi:phosphoribosylamine--glycine ligase